MEDRLKEILISLLTPKFGSRESASMARIYFKDKVSEKQSLLGNMEMDIRNDAQKLIDDIPLQYITGKAYFYDALYNVTRDVLIPRPETEELVALIIGEQQEEDDLEILEIGSGSGCIAISLSSNLKNSHILSVDVSNAAIDVAIENAKLHSAPVSFECIDFLDSTHWPYLGSPDILVSNPPYIQVSEKNIMSRSTLDYEPPVALFPKGEDPLVFYKLMCRYAQQFMQGGSMIYVEVNEYLAQETLAEFQHAGFEAQIKVDMQGKARIIKAEVIK